jgi:hypothetical protein
MKVGCLYNHLLLGGVNVICSLGCADIRDDPVTSGVPSYVVQEEFDRYTGYWWQPPPSGL